AGNGAELPARGDGGQLRYLRVELLALQRTKNDVVASGGKTEVGMRGVLALAHQQQRRRLHLRIAADLAAELRRGHVEQVESEDDELRPLHARLLQSLPGRKGGERRIGMAAAEDCLLKQQRPARVIDQENAAVVIHHAAVISRSLAMARLRSSTSIPICSAVFDFPRPKRMALKASRS